MTQTDTQTWKNLIAEAYANDSFARECMNRFNDCVNALKASNVPLEEDENANRLCADLILAVRAFAEGKMVSKLQCTGYEVN